MLAPGPRPGQGSDGMVDREEDGSFTAGRSAEEIRALFALDERPLPPGPVLDCAAGASAWVAEARGDHVPAVACDPGYAPGSTSLARRARRDAEALPGILGPLRWLFALDRYRDSPAWAAASAGALERFAADVVGPGRGRSYVAAALPDLPFRDRTFAGALCGRFLFLDLGGTTGAQPPRGAVRELVRVAREVRIAPVAAPAGLPGRVVEGVGPGVAVEWLAGAGGTPGALRLSGGA